MYECRHDSTEVRCKVAKNGAKIYMRQCLVCGRSTTTAIKHADLGDLNQYGDWDHKLESDWYDRQRQAWADERDQVNEDRNREYQSYLRTDTWKDKRNRVLARDKYVCQACLRRNATEVHHTTYEHIMNEPLFELISICDVCHRALHPDKQLVHRNGM